MQLVYDPHNIYKLHIPTPGGVIGLLASPIEGITTHSDDWCALCLNSVSLQSNIHTFS